MERLSLRHIVMVLARCKHVIVTALAFLMVGLFALVTLNLSFLSPIAHVLKDFSMTDIFYQIQRDAGEESTSQAITIVDMTDLYSRRELAATLEMIEKHQPKVIGVDVVFEGLKEDAIGDEMIRQTALTHPNIVFSYKLLSHEGTEAGYTDAVHSFFADTTVVHEGFTNMPRNLYGGMKRELSLGERLNGTLQLSFIAEVANGYAGKEIAKAEERDVKVNFSPTDFPVLSSEEVAKRPELIRDHVVLFGAMKDENDMHYTPLGKIAGVELLAYSVQTLLQAKEVKRVPTWLAWTITVLLVWLTSHLLSAYRRFFERRRNRFVRFLMTTTFMTGLFLFLWMGILMGCAFLLFSLHNISFNLGWAFAAFAFIASSTGFYEVCKNTWGTRNEK